jgi:hypothetical protein
MPVVTVIIATWNRGELLLPTLRSALAQRFKDFEVIIVGDGCTDNTAAIVAPFLGEQVRWINLNHNTGSQSFPNNVGNAMARGQYIAYLGHDDIWAPDHLSDLMDVVAQDSSVAFAIAGAVLHGPADSGVTTITGLFDHTEAARTHFFPPSSMLHRRDAIVSIGLWRSPLRSRLPVDCELQMRAVEAGMRFASTQKITAHKFAAGQRYLSYLLPSAAEQSSTLERLQLPHAAWLSDCVAAAKASKGYMTLHHAQFERPELGQFWRITRKIRGLTNPDLMPLTGVTAIAQSGESRSLDWNYLQEDGGFRWAGPNPRPRILIPFTHQGSVTIVLFLHFIADVTRQNFMVLVNGAKCQFVFSPQNDGTTAVELKTQLKADAPTIVELKAVPDVKTGRLRSLALGNVLLVPNWIGSYTA